MVPSFLFVDRLLVLIAPCTLRRASCILCYDRPGPDGHTYIVAEGRFHDVVLTIVSPALPWIPVTSLFVARKRTRFSRSICEDTNNSSPRHRIALN